MNDEERTSGYSRSIRVERAMTSYWQPRRGWRHRIKMLWPPYRRAEERRSELLWNALTNGWPNSAKATYD